MKPLIDGDVLRYEVGAIGEVEYIHPFDFVAEVLDGRIDDICKAVGATEPPLVFMTGKTNFRNEIAVSKPYKGNRKSYKPFHFNNINAYMRAKYEIEEAEGLEADDLLAIYQCQAEEGTTVICTRDKDLRMVPGYHYGWECGKQREYYLRLVDDEGSLDYDGKLKGTGMPFFYSQLLTGDPVDNIPGLPGCGPKKAWDLLEGVPVSEMWTTVRRAYEEKGYDREYLMEQAYLLWMVREYDELGNPVMFDPRRYHV
jgi:5'-3' exonuclease